MNLIKQKSFALFAYIVSAFAVLFAPASYAQSTAPDVSKLTDALDFSTVATAILDVGVAIVAVYITYKAVKMVISAIKSA